MTEYREAPEIASIVKTLVGKHHTRLADVRIECVWRDKAAKKNGKTVAGTAKKVSGLNAFAYRRLTTELDVDYGDEFFLIEIALDIWAQMSVRQREALIDHELTHCVAEWDEDAQEFVLGIRAHDIEAFNEEVERHGLWRDDLIKFAESLRTAEQAALFDSEDDEPEVDPDTGEIIRRGRAEADHG